MASAEATGDGKDGGGLIGFVIVTVLALGLGAGFGFFLADLSAPQVETVDVASAKSEPTDREAAKSVVQGVDGTAKLVAMTPIVVNLAQPQDAWIRIEASLLVQGMDFGADILAGQVAEDFVAYLRTATLSQFEGPSGFQNLREDFIDRATIRDREHIKDVIVHGVVIE
jgi:flagellar FliL protein